MRKRLLRCLFLMFLLGVTVTGVAFAGGINGNSDIIRLERVYADGRGGPVEMPAAEILAGLQGKWRSPEGKVYFEIWGDAVKDSGKSQFVKVKIYGIGTVSRGEGSWEFVNPPQGYSSGLDDIFRLYWYNGSLTADYYDGRGPHTTVRNRLIWCGY